MPITATAMAAEMTHSHYKPSSIPVAAGVQVPAANLVEVVTPHVVASTTHPYQLLSCITSVLDDWCRDNDLLGRRSLLLGPGVNGGYCRFRAVTKPQISIKDYMLRVQRYAECSETCFILALVYLNRLRSRPIHPVIIDSLSIHRLIITSVMLAAKFFDDRFFRNSLYAFVGGVTTGEMNQLESEMFTLLSHNACVTVDEYYQYDSALRYRSQMLFPQHPASTAPAAMPSHALSAAAVSSSSSANPDSPVTKIQKDFQNLLVLQHHSSADGQYVQHPRYEQNPGTIAIQAPRAMYPASAVAPALSAPPYHSHQPALMAQSTNMSQSLPATSNSPTLSTATTSSSRHSLAASSSVSTPSDMDCDAMEDSHPHNGVAPCDCDTVVVVNARDGSSSVTSVHDKLSISSSSSAFTSHVSVGSLDGASSGNSYLQPMALTRSTSVPALPIIR